MEIDLRLDRAREAMPEVMRLMLELMYRVICIAPHTVDHLLHHENAEGREDQLLDGSCLFFAAIERIRDEGRHEEAELLAHLFVKSESSSKGVNEQGCKSRVEPIDLD